MSSIVSKGVVFAAGIGVRMRPISLTIPKPLIKIQGKTMLDFAIDRLLNAGLEQIIVNTHYKHKLICNAINIRNDPRVMVIHEIELLETGGGFINAINIIDNNRHETAFFSCNSDTIFQNGAQAIQKLIKNWAPEKMDALLLVANREKVMGYHGDGDFNMDSVGKLYKSTGVRDYVYLGTQIIKRSLVEKIGRGRKKFSIGEVFSNCGISETDSSIKRIKALELDGMALHIGDPETLAQAEQIALSSDFS